LTIYMSHDAFTLKEVPLGVAVSGPKKFTIVRTCGEDIAV